MGTEKNHSLDHECYWNSNRKFGVKSLNLWLLKFCHTNELSPHSYVVRRNLRRAVRYASEKLNIKPGVLASLVPVVIAILVCCSLLASLVPVVIDTLVCSLFRSWIRCYYYLRLQIIINACMYVSMMYACFRSCYNDTVYQWEENVCGWAYKFVMQFFKRHMLGFLVLIFVPQWNGIVFIDCVCSEHQYNEFSGQSCCITGA